MLCTKSITVSVFTFLRAILYSFMAIMSVSLSVQLGLPWLTSLYIESSTNFNNTITDSTGHSAHKSSELLKNGMLTFGQVQKNGVDNVTCPFKDI